MKIEVNFSESVKNKIYSLCNIHEDIGDEVFDFLEKKAMFVCGPCDDDPFCWLANSQIPQTTVAMLEETIVIFKGTEQDALRTLNKFKAPKWATA